MHVRTQRIARSGLVAAIALAAALEVASAVAADEAEHVALAHFVVLRVEGPAEITLTQGAEESLTLESSPRGKTPLRIEESRGRLLLRTVGTGWDLLRGHKPAPRIALTFQELRAIELHDAVRLRVDGLRGSTLAVRASGDANLTLLGLDANDLTMEASGAMRAHLSGRVRQQKILISGAGVYDAAELRSDAARVLVSGAGRVSVDARDSLDVSVSGAGKVEYAGNPKVTKQVSGAARIERREPAKP